MNLTDYDYSAEKNSAEKGKKIYEPPLLVRIELSRQTEGKTWFYTNEFNTSQGNGS